MLRANAMVQIPTKRLTFEEYLAYDDGTDNRYELVNGELVLMPPPTGQHADIVDLLEDIFKAEIRRLNLDWAVRPGTIGVRTMELKTRFPDLSIITAEQKQAIRLKAAVLESPPLLVVEVVSPESVKRDYRYKRSEYAVLEIPEYWIVDSLEAKVTVLLLVEGLYEETEFKGNQQIISQTFPELALTVEQVLSVV